MGDFYSICGQFHLVVQSRDFTTTRIPLGLVQMCTLSQGLQNLGEHIMSGINKMLRDFIPDKTMHFLDNVIINGNSDEKIN